MEFSLVCLTILKEIIWDQYLSIKNLKGIKIQTKPLVRFLFAPNFHETVSINISHFIKTKCWFKWRNAQCIFWTEASYNFSIPNSLKSHQILLTSQLGNKFNKIKRFGVVFSPIMLEKDFCPEVIFGYDILFYIIFC